MAERIVLMVSAVQPGVRRPALHFFFLGAGFMLLETRSVTQMALLFGATWEVNAIVIASILAVIFVANLLVLAGKAPAPGVSYGLLFATLALGYFFPFGSLLELPFVARLAASAAAIGFPIAWASFLFSGSFCHASDAGRAFGSNLLGVVLGGSIEYSSNIVGLNALYFIALLVYALSLVFWPRRKGSDLRVPLNGPPRNTQR